MTELRPIVTNGVASYELEPLDVLFFRDGRPFDAAPRAASAVPMPQTIAGALRTWLLTRLKANFTAIGASIKRGGSFEEATATQSPNIAAIGRIDIRGPWFVKGGERVVPMPATIAGRGADGALHRLDPLADDLDLPGWSPPIDGMRPLWRRSRVPVQAESGYLSRSGLKRFLSGGLPQVGDIVEADSLFEFEDRVGIGIDPKRQTAKDGMIYAVRMMRLHCGVTLAVDLIGSPEDLTACPDGEDVLFLGGEARRAIIRRVPDAHAWPEIPTESADGQLVLLTCPAPLAGWRPPDRNLVAAAVPGHIPVSGWDLARGGPKPNRFAVPAGSVYFYKEKTGRANKGDSLCKEEDAAVGWGTCLEGLWNYA